MEALMTIATSPVDEPQMRSGVRFEFPGDCRRTIVEFVIGGGSKDDDKTAAKVFEYLGDYAKAALSTVVANARLSQTQRHFRYARATTEREEKKLAGTDPMRSWRTGRVFIDGKHTVITKVGYAIISAVLLLDVGMVVYAAAAYTQMSGAVASFAESLWSAVPFVFVFASALVAAKVVIDGLKTDSRRRTARQLVLLGGLFLFFAGFLPSFSVVFNLFTVIQASGTAADSMGRIEIPPPALGFIPAAAMVFSHLAGGALIAAGAWSALSADGSRNRIEMVVLAAKYRVQREIVERLRADLVALAESVAADRAQVEQIEAAIGAFVKKGMAYYEALRRRSAAYAEAERVAFLAAFLDDSRHTAN
jgi:hypothetical protein